MLQREQEITALLAFLPLPAYYFDYRSPRFIAVNQLFCDLLGYTEQEILTLPWKTFLPENQRAAADAAILAASQGAFPKHPIRWTFRRADGALVHGTAHVRDTRLILSTGETVDAHFVALVDTRSDLLRHATQTFEL